MKRATCRKKRTECAFWCHNNRRMRFSVECAFLYLGKRRATSRKSAFWLLRFTEKRILRVAPHEKAHSGRSGSRKSAVCPTDGLWNVLFCKMVKRFSDLGFLPQSQRTKQRRGTHLCIPSPPLYYARINLALYHTYDFSYASPVPERRPPLGTWAAPGARKSQGGQAREERNLPP